MTQPPAPFLNVFRHVVITGASGGIGAALARIYAAPEIRLSLLARGLKRLEILAEDCRARGAHVEAHAGDVQDAKEMESWLLACDSIQPVDLIIANAGIGGAGVLAPKFGEPGDVARRIISVNTFGVVNSVTPLLPRLVSRRAGHLAILSSVGAGLGLPDCPAYDASKVAIHAYGHALRRLLLQHGVRVTVISPGFVDTPMAQSLPFQPPFMWSADRAAAKISRGLARGRREIRFPWQISIAVRAARILPLPLVDRVLVRLRVGADKDGYDTAEHRQGR
jgi:short-subunit dehydrogenase